MRRTAFLLFSVLVLIALAAAATGCPAKEETTTTKAPKEEATTTSTEPKAEEPKIKFEKPKDGAEVDGPDVTAEVEVENFKIVNKLSQPNVEGEGHIHWFVDSTTTYTPNAEKTFTAKGLKAGKHTIKAELHQNSHEPLDPPVEAEVTFTVK